MKHTLSLLTVFAVWLAVAFAAQAQDPSSVNGVQKKAKKIVADSQDKVEEFAEKVDESQDAQEVSAGLLEPIYALAE